jgi:hypothetical protein
MTTVWTIPNLERNTDGDVVTTVHYVATKTDGDFVASVYSSMAVEVGDDFVPYADLTEATVVEWVKAKLDLESVEAALDAQIEAQKNPVTASGTPW